MSCICVVIDLAKAKRRWTEKKREVFHFFFWSRSAVVLLFLLWGETQICWGICGSSVVCAFSCLVVCAAKVALLYTYVYPAFQDRASDRTPGKKEASGVHIGCCLNPVEGGFLLFRFVRWLDCLLLKEGASAFCSLRWLLEVFLAVVEFVGFRAGGRLRNRDSWYQMWAFSFRFHFWLGLESQLKSGFDLLCKYVLSGDHVQIPWQVWKPLEVAEWNFLWSGIAELAS